MNYTHTQLNLALNKMGFEEFTEIQEKTIPLILEGKDIIGHSQTGTGKTAAFGVPIIEKIDTTSDTLQALILCPTRELAVQVKSELVKLSAFIPALKIVSVYGGESYNTQIRALKLRPQIIVGTPGRTIDLMNRKLIKPQNLKFFVLDEADEMLKMGFKEDIETLLSEANKDRQTILFSATMPKPIINISKQYMQNPMLISIAAQNETNKDIVQYYYRVQEQHKIEAISRLLQVYNPKLSLVFCNTKRKVDDVTRELTKKGFSVNKIHGDLAQAQRLQVLDQFKQGIINILVATDVAARGLDIKDIEVVFNYDVPEKPDFYVHRIGRTGRIGNTGHSFTLVSKRESRLFEIIERTTKNNIKKRNIPTPEKVIKIQEDNQYQDISDIIDTVNTHKHDELALRLLDNHDPIEIVSALLHSLEKTDLTNDITGDINEQEYSKQKQIKGDTVYTLNVGKKNQISPKQLAEFITRKTRLRNSQVSNIKISKSTTTFTTNSDKHTRIMKGLVGSKFAGVKLTVSV